MPKYSYKDVSPQTDQASFIAESATIIGNVVLGEGSNIWFQSVLRGDVNSMNIGKNTNIQDLCMLHVTEESALSIGANTSVGHSVTLHGCKVGDSCLVGMGATLLDDCEVGNHSLVAAGSVVTPRSKFPPMSLIMGAPAKKVRDLTREEVEFVSNHYKSYLGYSQEFADGNIVKLLD